jgi:hypothetical protein
VHDDGRLLALHHRHAEGASVVAVELRWVKSDPWYRSLRGDPRYAELLRKMDLPVD